MLIRRCAQICGKAFKRPQDLKKHEKIHTAEHHSAHKHSKAQLAPGMAPPMGGQGQSLSGVSPHARSLSSEERNSVSPPARNEVSGMRRSPNNQRALLRTLPPPRAHADS